MLLSFHPQCFLDSYSLLHCLVALNAEVEVEGTKLAASCIESDQLVDSRGHNSPSRDMEHNDQIKETESKAPKEPSPSVPKESLDKDETEIEKDAIPASAAGDRKTSHQSVSLIETSCVNFPDETSTELSKMIEHPSSAAVAQNDGVKAAPSEEQLLTEPERISGANSTKLSGDMSFKF